MNRDHRDYLLALLCIALAGGLAALFLLLTTDSEPTRAVNLIELVIYIIPSAIVALLSFPLIFFFLRRQGILREWRRQEVPSPVLNQWKKSSSPLNDYGWSGTITWEQASNAVGRLCRNIVSDGYLFDCVVSLADGGLIVADLLLFSRNFHAGQSLQIPVICLNLRRRLDPTKIIYAEPESLPIEYMKRFKRLLIVDEVSRSGKTMDAAITTTVIDLYKKHQLELPEIRIAVLGILSGGAPRADYSELEISSGETYPWGPFAEHLAEQPNSKEPV